MIYFAHNGEAHEAAAATSSINPILPLVGVIVLFVVLVGVMIYAQKRARTLKSLRAKEAVNTETK